MEPAFFSRLYRSTSSGVAAHTHLPRDLGDGVLPAVIILYKHLRVFGVENVPRLGTFPLVASSAAVMAECLRP
jgi:hypothetical protein